jgi:hypothetical protein
MKMKTGTKSYYVVQRRTSVAILILWTLFFALVPLVLALEGPVFPPPGGVTLITSGACAPPRPVEECIGRAGGTDLTFIDFDLSQSLALYWGPEDANAVGLAFDCAIDEPGETMTLDLGQSDLVFGMARWTGSADITYWDGATWVTSTLNTRFTLVTSDLEGPISLSPSTITDTAVVTVPGDFVANLLMEACYDDNWTPALELFDALYTRPEHEYCAISSVDHGFFYEDFTRIYLPVILRAYR